MIEEEQINQRLGELSKARESAQQTELKASESLQDPSQERGRHNVRPNTIRISPIKNYKVDRTATYKRGEARRQSEKILLKGLFLTSRRKSTKRQKSR